MPPWDDPCYQGTGVPGLTQRGDRCGVLESPGAEGLYCSWQNPSHILDCAAAQNVAQMARREAGIRFGSKDGLPPGGPVPAPSGTGDPGYGPPDGSMGNTFQHMVWNALMVDKVGYDRAKGFADRHEMTNISSDPQTATWELHLRGMDFANNHYGRELGVELLRTSSGSAFRQRLCDEAERFVRELDLACWVENYDANRRSTDPIYHDPSRCGLV